MVLLVTTVDQRRSIANGSRGAGQTMLPVYGSMSQSLASLGQSRLRSRRGAANSQQHSWQGNSMDL